MTRPFCTPSRRLAVVAVVALLVPIRQGIAQGNVSTLGQGYPVGQLSTRDQGSGGAFGEVDAESPLNPAALASWGTVGLHLQYDPEFRTVKSDGVTERTTTSRFPLFTGAIPIGKFTVGLSFSTLVDRTWATNTTTILAAEPGDTASTTANTKVQSTGGINDLRVGVAWAATSWLSLGAAMDWFTGQNQILEQVIVADTTPARYQESQFQSTISYGGVGASGGFVLKPTSFLIVAGSFRVGGNIRARLGDSTTLANGQVPGRAGGGVVFSGIPGVLLSGRVDWEQWSRFNGLTVGDVTEKDGVGWSVGTDIQGPRVLDRTINLRLGGGRRPLGSVVDGSAIMETDLSGGIGVPFGRGHAVVDLSLTRAFRSGVQGVTENAYILSTGLTIHP